MKHTIFNKFVEVVEVDPVDNLLDYIYNLLVTYFWYIVYTGMCRLVIARNGHHFCYQKLGHKFSFAKSIHVNRYRHPFYTGDISWCCPARAEENGHFLGHGVE